MAGFNPAMLTLVREYRQLTQAELAAAAGVTQGYVSKLESGLASPSDEKLERLGEALRWPTQFFDRPDQVYGFATACLYHRRQSSASVRTLRTVQALANILRIGVQPLLRDIAIDATNEFPVLDIEAFGGSPERVARMVRGTWRMPLGPVHSMVGAIESAGGLVYRVAFGSRRLDAVSHWPPGLPPMFLVNSEAPNDRTRFSLAHELGHIVMHRLPSQEMEREADKFASEFLMPSVEIADDLRGLDLARAAQLKAYWRVSIAALITRARDTKAIPQSRAKRLYAELSRLGYRLREPVQLRPEEPTILPSLVETQRSEHNYSVKELVSLAGIPADLFQTQYLNRSALHAVK